MRRIVCLLVAASALLPSVAGAEWFADVYLGAAITQKERITVRGNGTSGSVDSNPHDAAFVSGGRAGYWFDAARWFGLAADISAFEPGGDYFVAPISALLMARMPLMVDTRFPNGRLQPYVGAGPGLFLSSLEGTINGRGFEDSSADLGVDARAGAVWLITEVVGLFAEYRFTYFQGEYRDLGFTLETTVPTHHAVIGARFQF